MKTIIFVGVLTVLFASAAHTLHKLNVHPITYEIICGAIALSLFLIFEALIHERK